MFGVFRRPRSVRIDMAQCTTAPDGSDLAAAGGPLAGAVLVGGAVRDLLLGRPLTDLDWLVRDPRERAEALALRLAGSVVALDPERGHWRVVAAGRRWDLVAPETATGAPRADPLDPAALDRDLRRRDLTINAMAALPDGRVVDPTDGRADLAAGVVRLTGERALRDDALRAWRAVRIAAQLGFRLDEASAQAIAALAGELRGGARPLPATERIAAELGACLANAAAGKAFAALDGLGLLDAVLPELTAGRGVEQGGLHHLDVLQHQLEALQRLVDAFPEADAALRWATVLHDVGKPLTREHDEGDRPRFHGHDAVGAEVTERALTRLRLPHAVAARAAALVAAHMRPLPKGEKAARRFVHRLRPLLPDLLRLMVADREAARGPLASEAGRRRYRLALAEVIQRLEDEPAPSAPLLDGFEVMRRLGLPAGPTVGVALSAVAEARAVGEVATPDEAEAYLRRMAAAQGWPVAAAAERDDATDAGAAVERAPGDDAPVSEGR
jgi:poly(A) polymerase